MTASYAWNAGTSMATPQVTGLAALICANGLHDATRCAAAPQTADDLGPSRAGRPYGFGRINAYRAVTGLDPYAPPVPIGGPYTAAEGVRPVRRFRVVRPQPQPITFLWNFGDGFSSTLASLSRVYADNGSFSASLQVTDESGHASSTAVPVTIRNVAPAVTASIDAATIASGASATLAGTFSDPGVNDAPWAWNIDWGNGSASGSLATQSAIAATRRFCQEGSYTVRLAVTDKDGGTGGAELALTVTPNAAVMQLPGSFNVKSNGSFPVTILGTASLDVRTIDAATVTLGGGLFAARKNDGSLHVGLADANGDGRLDLTVHFSRPELVARGVITQATTDLVVRATLADGCTRVSGSAGIAVH